MSQPGGSFQVLSAAWLISLDLSHQVPGRRGKAAQSKPEQPNNPWSLWEGGKQLPGRGAGAEQQEEPWCGGRRAEAPPHTLGVQELAETRAEGPGHGHPFPQRGWEQLCPCASSKGRCRRSAGPAATRVPSRGRASLARTAQLPQA